MYYRLNQDGSVLDYSKSKYHDDCLFTDKALVESWDHNLYVEGSEPAPPADIRQAYISAKLSKVVQKRLDDAAVARGYDSCLAVCSYINSGVRKFDTEGKAFRKWRSAVWDKFFDIMAELDDPSVATPSAEQVIKQLPDLSVMYE